MISDVSCVVLAGGESRRMGSDKAQVQLAGLSLLQRVLKVVNPLFDDVMVSRHDDKKGAVSLFSPEDTLLLRNSPDCSEESKLSPFLSSVRIIEDQLDGRGPVIGLCRALQQARHPYVFVTACDMPFISAGLITCLSSFHSDFDIVVPVRDGRPEPLFAVYSKSCLDELLERVKQGNRGLTSFIRQTNLRVHYVETQQLQQHDPALHSFVDVDSASMLAEAETILAGAGCG